MLETIREFAAEQLVAAGEAGDLQRRHLTHYAAVAEVLDETHQGGDDFDRLEEERRNLRLAFDTALQTNPELALELARRITWLLVRRGEQREGRAMLAAALASAPDTTAAARAWALQLAGDLAYQQGELDAADGPVLEALAMFRELGDQRGEDHSLSVLGWIALARLDTGEARRLFEEAAASHGTAGDKTFQRRALLAWRPSPSRTVTTCGAVSIGRDVVARTRHSGSSFQLALALVHLGESEAAAGEMEAARREFEECVALPGRKATNHFLPTDSRFGLPHAGNRAGRRARTSRRKPPDLPRDGESGFYRHLSSGGRADLRGAPRLRSCRCAAGCRPRHRGSDRFPPHRRRTGRVRRRRDAVPRRARPTRFHGAWNEGAALDAIAAAEWALERWEGTK